MIKKVIFYILKFLKKPFLIFFFLFFPINLSFMEEMIIEENMDENEDSTSRYIIYTIFGVVIIMLLSKYFQDSYNPFSYFIPKDPYDMSIIYSYPNDGKVRPPQNPETLALESYFVIPGKPYFVNGEINYPLLNRDMLEYMATPLEWPKDRAIPAHVVKWLEICYGYDISQDIFMNLKLHRELTNPSVGMDYLLRFVKWYYRYDVYRDIYSLWLFTPEEAPYYEGKDFYDLRIFPEIYTRKWDWPKH